MQVLKQDNITSEYIDFISELRIKTEKYIADYLLIHNWVYYKKIAKKYAEYIYEIMEETNYSLEKAVIDFFDNKNNN